MNRRTLAYVSAFASIVSGCASHDNAVVSPDEAGVVSPAAVVSPEVAARAAVAAPDRSEDDRALDAGRKPAEVFSFFGIGPGMRVAELGAGGGYSSELLARIVGPSGVVYGQNSQFILDRFAEKPWSERLAKPINRNIVRLDAPFDAPFAAGFADQGKLDAVVDILFYHDTVWLGVDRAAMNKAVFDALAPGGTYGIVDHSARDADGIAVTETFHRIAEAVVVSEVEAAGFVLVSRADFLRNPADTRDWNDSPRVAAERRGTSDRFVLKFTKPR